MNSFWTAYSANVEFALVAALFSLSAFLGLWSGVLSLAPIAFACGAAFTSARIDLDHPGLPLMAHLIIGMLVGAALAYASSLILLRLSSHYLALATIATVLISRVIVLNLPQYTGATLGIPVTRIVSTWQLVLILSIVCLVFNSLRKSRFGYSLDAVREQPEVAASIGLNVLKIRRIAFVLSGVVGGLAGVLQSQLMQYITPDAFYVDLAFISIAAAVLGGAYIWVGAIVGAFVYAALPEVLRPFLGNSKNIANGVILILIMVFMQRGLIDPVAIKRITRRLRNSIASPSQQRTE